jgi:hypothetical protein
MVIDLDGTITAFVVLKRYSNSAASPFLRMEVFKNTDGRRSFIFPGFCTTPVFEIFDEMRHKELRFRFGGK